MLIPAKTIGSAVYTAIILMLLCIGALLAVSGIKLPGNARLFVVQSGSMEPAVHIGSVVVTQAQRTYTKGDIITVRDSARTTVTHRITEIRVVGNQSYYTTKGDANKSADTDVRLGENVIGKTMVTIPYLGFVLNFAKTKNGLLFLVIFPSLILMYNELLSIKSEAQKLIHERKTRLTLKEKVALDIGEEELRKLISPARKQII